MSDSVFLLGLFSPCWHFAFWYLSEIHLSLPCLWILVFYWLHFYDFLLLSFYSFLICSPKTWLHVLPTFWWLPHQSLSLTSLVRFELLFLYCSSPLSFEILHCPLTLLIWKFKNTDNGEAGILKSHMSITQLQQYLTYCQSYYMFTLPLKKIVGIFKSKFCAFIISLQILVMPECIYTYMVIYVWSLSIRGHARVIVTTHTVFLWK